MIVSNSAWMVGAMSRATAAWSQAEPNVQYQHVASQDGNCNNRNGNVVFNVRPVSTSQYLARAVFPNSSRRGREILGASIHDLLRETLVRAELSPRFRAAFGADKDGPLAEAVERLRAFGARYAELERLQGLRPVPAAAQ